MKRPSCSLFRIALFQHLKPLGFPNGPNIVRIENRSMLDLAHLGKLTVSILSRSSSAELSRGGHIDPPVYHACTHDLVIVLRPFLVLRISVGSCV